MRITILFLLLAGGCSMFGKDVPPEKRLSNANALYAVTVSALDILHETEVIDADLYARLTPFMASASAALQAMQLSLADPDVSDFERGMSVFTAAMVALVAARQKYEPEPVEPEEVPE